MSLDVATIRDQFPALRMQAQQPDPALFLDNPGGTQIAQPAMERMFSYLVEHNANHGGAFLTSRLSDEVLEEAHTAMADLYNAACMEEIVFGNNMTSLTLQMSRSISRTWRPGETILVTRLDHDANITPWVLAAEERGCKVRWVDFHPEDGTLDLEDFQRALEDSFHPRLAAFGYASNALGTINPVEKLTRMTHEAGALVYIDAVQYAPHGPIDVQRLGCDFLVASAYKFFGPHAGILYGRNELLEELYAYKVRPAPNLPPGKFETGTQNHEGMAGVLGAVDYLAWLGDGFGKEYDESYSAEFSDRRLLLKKGLAAVRAYELELSRALLSTLSKLPGVQIYGLDDPRRLDERVPTFSFTLAGHTPRQIAEYLAEQHINAWSGNYYALAITERLGLEESGGMLRVGAVHYNTLEEVARLGEALSALR